MKKVRLTALIAALIACVGIYFFLKEISKPQEPPRTEAVVAVVDIPENTQITEEMVALRPILTEALSEHHLEEIESAVGLVSSGAIFAGEQIVTDRLARTGETGDDASSLAYIVDNGMRAVTVAVNAVSGIENLIRPGNRVDVLTSYSYEPEDGGEDGADSAEKKTATGYLAQNKKVLAVGTMLGKDGTEEYVTVTLEASPEEAALISYAEYIGSLKLVLRSMLDTDVRDFGEVDIHRLREEVATP